MCLEFAISIKIPGIDTSNELQLYSFKAQAQHFIDEKKMFLCLKMMAQYQRALVWQRDGHSLAKKAIVAVMVMVMEMEMKHVSVCLTYWFEKGIDAKGLESFVLGHFVIDCVTAR